MIAISLNRLAPITLVVSALLVAGCGGSSRPAAPAPAASADSNVAIATGSGGSLAAPGRRINAHVGRAVKRTSVTRAELTPDRSASSLVKASEAGAGIPSALHAIAKTLLRPAATARTGGTLEFTRSGGSDSVFLRSADSICRNYRATVRAIGADATTLALQEAELQNLAQASGDSLRRLQALAPPATDTALAERFITLTSRSITDFIYAQSRSTSTSEAVGTAGEMQDMEFAQRSAHDALSAQAAARKLGLKVCGSPGAEWF